MYEGDNEVGPETPITSKTNEEISRNKNLPHLKSENKWVDVDLK